MQQKIVDIDLIASRNEQLAGFQNGQLRPLGKKWGLNAFEWKFPLATELLAFLKGVPFKTIVVISSDVLNMSADLIEEMLPIQCVVAYNGNTVSEKIKDNTNLLCVDSLSSVFQLLPTLSGENDALLFIADGPNADDDLASFINEMKKV